MPVEVKNDLASFHDFVGKQLNNGGAVLSPESALALWQEHLSTIAAIQEGLDDVEAGRTTPIDEFIRDFRREHNLPIE